MAKDNRIETVIANWAPRFISNGIPWIDYQEVTDQIETWDEWCPAWAARAKVHEDLGRDALAKGHNLSAGEHLDRAGVLYHFAKFVFVNDMAQMKAIHMKAVACHHLALPHLQPPGERVEMTYETGHLPGILRKPVGVEKPPVMIMCPGLDSAKEEFGTNQMHYLRRGIATLAIDGPGQGESEYDYPIRGDYEVAVAAVCDYIDTRDDLDSDRIGIWGVSFGGYYAPRAAAFEKRLKACIAVSGPFDYGEMWATKSATTKETFRIRSHSKNLDDAYEVAKTVTLKDVAKNITCPLYVITGDVDPLVPASDAERLAEHASGPTDLMIVERGNHVVNNFRYKWDAAASDWMAEKLGV